MTVGCQRERGWGTAATTSKIARLGGQLRTKIPSSVLDDGTYSYTQYATIIGDALSTPTTTIPASFPATTSKNTRLSGQLRTKNPSSALDDGTFSYTQARDDDW